MNKITMKIRNYYKVESKRKMFTGFSYKECKGIVFPEDVEDDVIKALVYAYETGVLIRIYHGDKKNGYLMTHLENCVGRLRLAKQGEIGPLVLMYKGVDVPAGADGECAVYPRDILKIELFSPRREIYESPMYINDIKLVELRGGIHAVVKGDLIIKSGTDKAAMTKMYRYFKGETFKLSK